MAAPTFVNVGNRGNVSFGNSVTPTLPTSLVNGNLLIAWLNASTTGNAHTVTFPVGWNMIGTPISDANGNSAGAWRIVDGTETDPTITWVGGSFGGADDAVALIYQYTGVDAVHPIGEVHNNLLGSGGSASATEAGVNVGRNNSLVVSMVIDDTGVSALVTPPSGYSYEDGNTTGNGTITATDSAAFATALDATGPITTVMAQIRHWMSWTVEIASEPLLTDIDIPDVAPAAGIAVAAALDLARVFPASPGVGVSLAVTIDNATAQIVASLGLGIGISAVLSAQKNVPVSNAFGASLAAVLTREVVETTSFVVGFGMHVSFGGHKRQPVVNLLS